MKFIVSVILILLLAFISGLFLPWWGIAIAALLVALIIPQRPWKSFLSGFFAVFLLWVLLAWWIDMKNNGVLSQRMSELLPLGGSRILLILVTGFVGAIVAGFAALTGAYLRTAPGRS
jgi:hypothetical protein